MKRKGYIRHIIQAMYLALTNGYIYGYMEGKIYTGKSKKICVPGLNCYSCPGAIGACPIGALQSVLDGPTFKFSCYVLGFLILFGSIFGRFVCGFLCPFGFVQDFIYKIPFFVKKKNIPGHKLFIKIKYIILILFVVLLPALVIYEWGFGKPWFCEYICPSGTLFGGIPLVISNETIRWAITGRFYWKMGLLILILLISIIYYRPFCKYICPLGAFYSVFNGFSLYRYEVDNSKCNKCGKCSEVCKMGIVPCDNPNSPECIRCGDCKRECPSKAIKNVSKSNKD